MSKQATKALIDANITANGTQAITGPILNNVLNTIVDDYGTQVEVSQLSQKVNGGEQTSMEKIDLSALTHTIYYISAQNLWTPNAKYDSVLIPVVPAKPYKIVATGSGNTYYAWLKSSSHVSGDTADYATGETRKSITDGESIEETAPADANYLYVCLIYNASDRSADVYQQTTVVIEGLTSKVSALEEDVTELQADVAALEDAIESFGDEDKSIDLSGLVTSLAMINSSNQWANNISYATALLPVSPGGKYTVINSRGGNMHFALLKTDVHTVGETPDFCAGYESRILIADGDLHSFTGPSDIAFLYLSTIEQGVTVKQTVNRFDEMEEDIDTIEGAMGGAVLESGTANNYILNKDGTTTSSARAFLVKTFPCIGGATYLITGRVANILNTCLACFYDGNGTLLSYIKESEGVAVPVLNEKVIAPAGAKTIKVAGSSANDYSPSLKRSGIVPDVAGLKEDVAELQAERNPFLGKKMVVTGASTDYGQTVDNPYTHSYGYQAAEALGMSYVNYAIGGTCWSKGNATDYAGVFFSMSAFEAATKDETKDYLVKSGQIGEARPWRLYHYSGGEWVQYGSQSINNGRTPLVDRLPEMDTDADVIIVGGAASNDWTYRSDNLGEDYIYDGDGAETNADTAKLTVIGALHLMCRYLMRTYPGKLVLFTHFMGGFRYQPRGISNITWDCVTPDAENPDGYMFSDYIEAIKKVLSQYEYQYVDLGESLGMSPYNPGWWCGDQDGKYVHPNLAGHTLAGKALVAKLLSLRGYADRSLID